MHSVPIRPGSDVLCVDVSRGGFTRGGVKLSKNDYANIKIFESVVLYCWLDALASLAVFEL